MEGISKDVYSIIIKHLPTCSVLSLSRTCRLFFEYTKKLDYFEIFFRFYYFHKPIQVYEYKKCHQIYLCYICHKFWWYQYEFDGRCLCCGSEDPKDLSECIKCDREICGECSKDDFCQRCSSLSKMHWG